MIPALAFVPVADVNQTFDLIMEQFDNDPDLARENHLIV